MLRPDLCPVYVVWERRRLNSHRCQDTNLISRLHFETTSPISKEQTKSCSDLDKNKETYPLPPLHIIIASMLTSIWNLSIIPIPHTTRKDNDEVGVWPRQFVGMRESPRIMNFSLNSLGTSSGQASTSETHISMGLLQRCHETEPIETTQTLFPRKIHWLLRRKI